MAKCHALFLGRLRWHCHFIQKLEDEPSLESMALHPMMRDLDQLPLNEETLYAWANGTTGFPMVDACMRALNHTGWLNFRMRAMLMSIGAHHLQLPWQACARHLATQFVDYEPGIHYSQCQMQAGRTGINAIRIYNPIKQGTDHDPSGVFVREWLPELSDVPDSGIHHPWLYGKSDQLLMKNRPGNMQLAFFTLKRKCRIQIRITTSLQKAWISKTAIEMLQVKNADSSFFIASSAITSESCGLVLASVVIKEFNNCWYL